MTGTSCSSRLSTRSANSVRCMRIFHASFARSRDLFPHVCTMTTHAARDAAKAEAVAADDAVRLVSEQLARLGGQVSAEQRAEALAGPLAAREAAQKKLEALGRWDGQVSAAGASKQLQ